MNQLKATKETIELFKSEIIAAQLKHKVVLIATLHVSAGGVMPVLGLEDAKEAEGEAKGEVKQVEQVEAEVVSEVVAE